MKVCQIVKFAVCRHLLWSPCLLKWASRERHLHCGWHVGQENAEWLSLCPLKVSSARWRWLVSRRVSAVLGRVTVSWSLDSEPHQKICALIYCSPWSDAEGHLFKSYCVHLCMSMNESRDPTWSWCQLPYIKLSTTYWIFQVVVGSSGPFPDLCFTIFCLTWLASPLRCTWLWHVSSHPFLLVVFVLLLPAWTWPWPLFWYCFFLPNCC